MSFPLPPLEKRKDSDYDIGELLGRGNFTSVYSAIELATGKRLAIKIIDRYRCEKLKKTPDLHMEKHCLRRLNHHNIIKMSAHFTDTLTVFVVMEECLGGELWDSVKTVGCADPLARHYLVQLVNAIHYLRQAHVIHRDLKAENCMISEGGILKLIDFGTAKDLENPHIKGAGNASRHKVFEHYVGTPQFMPPEVINNTSTDNRSDTWSLACTIFQTLVGIPPFHAASEYLVFCKIMDMNLKFPPGVNPDAKDLINRMIVKDPDARLGAQNLDDIRKHAFFAGVPDQINIHKRSVPVPSLAACCLLKIGRNLKNMEDEIAAWPKKDQLEPWLLEKVARMQIVLGWQDEATPPDADV